VRAPLHSLSHFHATPSALAALLVSGIHNWRLSSSSLLALSLNLYKCMWRKKRNTKFTIKKKHKKKENWKCFARNLSNRSMLPQSVFFFFLFKSKNRKQVSIGLHFSSLPLRWILSHQPRKMLTIHFPFERCFFYIVCLFVNATLWRTQYTVPYCALKNCSRRKIDASLRKTETLVSLLNFFH
jgi:hypothetical protein